MSAPNYDRPEYQPPNFKPVKAAKAEKPAAEIRTNFKKGKVAAKLEQIEQQIKAVSVEDGAKKAAKVRDHKRCRWPHTKPEERELCRRSRWLEAMHWKAKGMGGAPSRNVRKNIITGCPVTHQGPNSIHAGKKRIKPLDPTLLMDGPCIFEEKVGDRWIEVGRESHVGILTKLPSDPLMERD